MPWLKLIQAKRKHNRESIVAAAVFLAQIVICATVLLPVYNAFHARGPMWVLIAAIMTLQPGFDESLAASVTRIVANIVGALTGACAGILFGRDLLAILTAFTVVVAICEYFRLDRGMRTACVSVAIVLVRSDESIVQSGVERVIAVVIGCVFAVVLQLLTERYVKPLILPKRRR